MSGTCERIRGRLADELSGSGRREGRAEIDRHMKRCAACRAYASGLADDDRALTELGASVAAGMPGLEARVLRGFGDPAAPHAASSRSWRQLPVCARLGGWRLAGAVAAALVLVFAGGRIATRHTGKGIAWAEVLSRVSAAADYVCRVRMESNRWDDVEWVEYNSAAFGIRREYFKDGRHEVTEYIPRDGNVFYMVDHEQQAYATGELTAVHAERQHKMSRAQEWVSSLRDLPHTPLGGAVIAGVQAAGIEVRSPSLWGATYEDGYVRLWVDPETGWPLKLETVATADGGRVRTRFVHEEFQWNAQLTEADVAFDPDGGYRRQLDFGPVEASEEAALEGLRRFGRVAGGRYPSTLVFETAVAEAQPERDRRKRSGRWSDRDIEDTFALRSTCAFWASLRDEGRDPAYHGDRVGPLDATRVLLRWRPDPVDSTRYRVVYGDLRVSTIPVSRLRDLDSSLR